MKKKIRRKALLARRAISPEQRRIDSKAICDMVLKSEDFNRAETVFCYVSMDDEVDTSDILKKTLEAGKKLYVPYITEERGIMLAIPLRKVSDLIPGACRILTAPRYGDELEAVSPEDIDLAIVPGAAFTSSGQRIGMGGGYYDRFLANLGGTSAGIAYSCQMYHKLPVEKHDQKLDMVFTNGQESSKF